MKMTAKHVYLRPIRKDDIFAIHLYASDSETTKYMLWGPNSYQETINYVESTLALPHLIPIKIYRFGIILRYSDDLIGMIDLTLKSKHIGELGYIINRSYWGRGYASEAAHLLVDCGFKTLGLTRILATCDRRNIASYRVMEKNGFHLVGTYRRYNPKYDEEMDGLLYELDRH